MITLPNVVEPPDLILVELLEGLPGRPISGERLLRPDGMISLGFYGDVYVKGLTLDQVKVAIIKRLRNYLTDEALGLESRDFDEPPDMPQPQDIPAKVAKPLGRESNTKVRLRPRTSSDRSSSTPRSGRIRSASQQSSDNRVPVRPIGSQGVSLPTDNPKLPVGPNPFEIPAGTQGKVTITIELNGQGALEIGKPQPGQVPQPVPEVVVAEESPWRVIPPAKSHTVSSSISRPITPKLLRPWRCSDHWQAAMDGERDGPGCVCNLQAV